VKQALRAALRFLRSIDFTTIIMGALAGFGGWWGKILSFIAKPVISSVENKIDDQIAQYDKEETSDAAIDQAAKEHVDQIQKAKTDEEIDDSFRDSLR
jgi:hypothetical protein